eukprot:3589685-Amphidinium_carterae.1
MDYDAAVAQLATPCNEILREFDLTGAPVVSPLTVEATTTLAASIPVLTAVSPSDIWIEYNQHITFLWRSLPDGGMLQNMLEKEGHLHTYPFSDDAEKLHVLLQENTTCTFQFGFPDGPADTPQASSPSRSYHIHMLKPAPHEYFLSLEIDQWSYPLLSIEEEIQALKARAREIKRKRLKDFIRALAKVRPPHGVAGTASQVARRRPSGWHLFEHPRQSVRTLSRATHYVFS